MVADVCFHDKAGLVYLSVENMVCIASAELNRLGGTASFRGDLNASA